MRNLIDPERLGAALAREYGLRIDAMALAPRGFVAETFRVTAGDEAYFAKCVKNGWYSENIAAALPVLRELFRRGIDQIAAPLPGLTGALSFDLDDHLCALYPFIDGVHSYQFDLEPYVDVLASVHQQRIALPITREDYTLPIAEAYQRRLAALWKSAPEDPHEAQMRQVLIERRDYLETHWRRFLDVQARCMDAGFQEVITHCDGPGNVLIRSDGLPVIVDWDDLKLAPAERDTWFHLLGEARPCFLARYRRTFPDYEPDPLAYAYYVYRRYFEDVYGMIEEMQAPDGPAGKAKYLDWLAGVFAWLEPHIATFEV